MQEETKLLFEARPELPYAIEEAVNRLRINISFLGKDVRKIMIASSEPNEGKSFVAFHLWDQIARSGEKSSPDRQRYEKLEHVREIRDEKVRREGTAGALPLSVQRH